MGKKKIPTLARPIVTDKVALSKVCTTIKTLQNNPVLDEICVTLIDTYNANKENCIGLAANQIGFNKRVILVKLKYNFIIMINPVFKGNSFHGRIRDKESCLSFPGKESKVKRYKQIKVAYDPYSKEPVNRLTHTYTKLEARIIQHEIDHLNGICL